MSNHALDKKRKAASKGKNKGVSTSATPSSASSLLAKADLDELCHDFLQACENVENGDTYAIEVSLNKLRQAVLFHGIKENSRTKLSCSLRGKVWKILLALDNIDAQQYISLIKQGKCEDGSYKQIRSDSFRTLTKATKFQQEVKEEEIIRVLNSFVHANSHYCQGMNTVCCPFLFNMPEVDAYFAFTKLITKKIPQYYQNKFSGAQAGCHLIDMCLEELDPPLYQYLKNHQCEGYIYAFHAVASLGCSLQPFSQVLQLWDFLMCFGPQFIVICLVAQILSLKEDVFKAEYPKAILDYRKWPPLNARFVISMAMSILPRLSPDLYRKICLHATQKEVVLEITKRRSAGGSIEEKASIPVVAESPPAIALDEDDLDDLDGFDDDENDDPFSDAKIHQIGSSEITSTSAGSMGTVSGMGTITPDMLAKGGTISPEDFAKLNMSGNNNRNGGNNLANSLDLEGDEDPFAGFTDDDE